MKFSLIIPTCGRIGELANVIDSVRAQTGAQTEIIVSDQNADDRVERLLAERGWSEIVAVVKSSGGASAARNAGIARANGEILGFPDDDCVYPPGLVEKLARFFETHPEAGFATGRSFADDGADAASRHARVAAPISRGVIHRQVIEFCLWIRRDALGSLRFDENLGTGCGTPWQADEGPDLVLRLMEREVRGWYDPAFAVWHPRPDLDDPRLVDRAYRYACGSGYFLRKHAFPLSTLLYFIARAAAGAKISLLRGRRQRARFYVARMRGLVRGWRGFRAEKSG